ncbi:hypothetical protein BD779DRAFT_1432771 [Infundibulicybe gibba]|nr:hypothetical protein BD779DRAFT_1432771 [Infundibulicybe gibba]
MTSTITFPIGPAQSEPVPSSMSDASRLSVVSCRATALEVCYAVYGESSASIDAVDRFYEANASAGTGRYENPVLTATSRSVISDIHKLSRQLSAIDVPRPLAMLCTLLRLKPPNVGFLRQRPSDTLFQAVRVWNDVGEICESESFDGHRKTIVEHTLNVLFLPGIHSDGINNTEYHRSVVTTDSPSSQLHYHPPTSLSVPGTSLSVPSPLHFKLPIITRLSFNEQGRVTHHRDFWDVKDVIGLVPGVSLAQWIGTRLAARSLSCVSRFWTRGKTAHQPPSRSVPSTPPTSDPVDLENGMTPAAAYVASTRNALGLEGSERATVS